MLNTLIFFILSKPRRPLSLGGEEVAIVTNNQIFFVFFSYNIENFCFLTIFIYNNDYYNVPFHICTFNK